MAVSWVLGSQYKAKAEDAKRVMDELAETGQLCPAKLVEVSRPKSAPLHADLFDLNDRDAAQKWREEKARHMIVSIVVTPDEKETHVTRAYYNIERGTHEYIPTEVIFSDEAKKDRLLEYAKQELERFRFKYRKLKELDAVFNAIDEIIGGGE